MSMYKSFILDFPERVRLLDEAFCREARSKRFEVTFLLMKLSASFLLPYERIKGTSSVRPDDGCGVSNVRVKLELDKRFHESGYCASPVNWFAFEVEKEMFSAGDKAWPENRPPLEKRWVVHKVLKRLRHALAHSNIHFGGEEEISHVYFGSWLSRTCKDRFQVFGCGINDLRHLSCSWIENLARLDQTRPVIAKVLAMRPNSWRT